MSWRTLAVLLWLPIFAGVHCGNANCDSASKEPRPTSSPSATPIWIAPGKIVEVQVAAGVIVGITATEGAVAIYRNTALSEACAGLRQQGANAVRLEKATGQELPPIDAREPVSMRANDPNQSQMLTVSGETLRLGALNAEGTYLLVAYRGRQPPVYGNESIHGTCVSIPYKPLGDPIERACELAGQK